MAILASLYARIVPGWDLVVPEPGRVQLLGIDPYYHLRHVSFSVEHFPAVQRWDVGTHYPWGERSEHAGLFHIVLAFVALVLGLGSPSERLVTWVLAWSPIAFHALLMLLLFWLARRLFRASRHQGLEYATLTVGVFALFPGLAHPRSMLGFGDHHVVEILLYLAVLSSLCAALEYHRQPAPQRVEGESIWQTAQRVSQRWRYTLPLILFVFTWAGAALAILLVALSLGILVMFDVWRDLDVAASARTARDQGLAVGAVLMAGHWFAPDTILVMHLFWATVGVSFGLALFGVIVLRVIPALASKLGPARATWLVTSVAAATIALALWLIPAYYFSLLLESKSAAVKEHQAVGWSMFLKSHGVHACLALATMAVAARVALKQAKSADLFLVATFGTLLGLLWFKSHDYGYAVPPFVALLSCIVIYTWAEAPASGAPQRQTATAQGTTRLSAVWQRTRPWLPVGLLAVSLLHFWPIRVSPNPFAMNARGVLQITKGWFEAMDWLRRSTPAPRPSVLDQVPAWIRHAPHPFAEDQFSDSPFGEGSYGVMGAWDFGNFVSALGRRTPIWSHGTAFHVADWLVSPDEETSFERLCTNCGPNQEIKYVVLSAPTLAEHFMTKVTQSSRHLDEFRGQYAKTNLDGRELVLGSYGEAYDQTIAARLYSRDASGLEHYRLIYESPHQSLSTYKLTVRGNAGSRTGSLLRESIALDSPEQVKQSKALLEGGGVVQRGSDLLYGYQVTSSVKLFEIVKGAELVGSSWPHARVSVDLELEATTTGRRFKYVQTTMADAQGEFRLTVPHASSGASEVVVARSPWRLLILPTAAAGAGEGLKANITVSEEAVRTGGTLQLGKISTPR